MDSNRKNLTVSQLLEFPPSPAQKRKTKILETVVEILSEQGVDELTFEKIGTRAKMSRSHVLYYFKNREELVLAAIRLAALTAGSIIQQAVDGESDWKKALLKYVDANFHWIASHPNHVTVYLLLYYQASFKERYRTIHHEIQQVGLDRIKAILCLGPFRPESKRIEAIALFVQSLIRGQLMGVVTTKDQKKLSQRLTETKDSIRKQLRDVW